MLRRVKAFLEGFLPEGLSFKPVPITLDSGLRAYIDSRLTLQMFVELFLTQPYGYALSLPRRIDSVVDLGANRGLFLLFTLQYMWKLGRDERPRFLCVEAARPNFHRLERHIEMNNLTGRVRAVHGAICGRRSGEVDFYYAPRFHGMAAIVRRNRLTTRRVPVVDLGKYVDNQRIDVLKMDIEGAEEGFLQEYGEILEKTQVLVGEFHLKEIDYANCQTILKRSGLMFDRRTFQYKDTCVDVYVRPSCKG